jgi:FeS assembly SUF system regulator
MLRVTKLADYGIIVLTYFARNKEGVWNARDIAQAIKLPLPVISKVLKLLSKERLLRSQRGTKGGYSLALPPEEITVASIIRALEGPIAMTECTNTAGECSLEPRCPVRTNWQMINRAIHSALEQITLAQMTQPLQCPTITLAPWSPSATKGIDYENC